MDKTFRLGAGALAIILASVGFVLLRPKDRSPEEVRRIYFESIKSADPDAFLSVVDRTEIERNGLSRDDIRRLLQEQIRPALTVSSTAPEVIGDGSNGSQLYNHLISIDGREHLLPIAVGKTSDGLRVVLPISTLYMSFVSAKGGLKNQVGAAKLAVYLKGAEHVNEAWEPYKIKYIQLSAAHDPMTTTEFREWTERRMKSGPTQ